MLCHLLAGEVQKGGLEKRPFPISADTSVPGLTLQSVAQGYRRSSQLPLEVVVERYHQSHLFGRHLSLPGARGTTARGVAHRIARIRQTFPFYALSETVSNSEGLSPQRIDYDERGRARSTS